MMHRILQFALTLGLFLPLTASAWWDKAWTIRQPVTIDTGASGVELKDTVGDAVVLLRLHDGNFNFAAAAPDGSDIRILAEDDQTLLPYHIEKYDSLMNEAFVWVRVPNVKPGAQTQLWLYSGNAEGAENVQDAAKTYEGETVLVYHFVEAGSPPADASGKGNNATSAGTQSQGSLIGSGVRLLGTSIDIPASDTLAVEAGGALTWSAWVKRTADQPSAVLFELGDTTNGLRIGIDNSAPYAEVISGGQRQRATGTEPLPLDQWRHLAARISEGTLSLLVGGVDVATANAALPAINGPARIGGESGTATAFIGELDELQIVAAAKPNDLLRFDAVNQGTSSDAGKLVQFGEVEQGEGGGGHNEALEHLSLFGDIAKNMMFDGWIVIFCCMIMAVVGWTVAIRKYLYLNRIEKSSNVFQKHWSRVAADLTVLDRMTAGDEPEGEEGSPGELRLMKQSPLYQIYHIGAQEIRLRRQQSKEGFNGLSGRSIQAIRASLDEGLTNETHKLNKGLVFLTISIAGGPYVGLLGTVMGVMITFAVIAKHGEVDVNSIAPGIASALLATVAGLVVAIPALFIYSYLNSRIKDAVTSMQMFIDKFVTKMAEFYPAPAEAGNRGLPDPSASLESASL